MCLCNPISLEGQTWTVEIFVKRRHQCYKSIIIQHECWSSVLLKVTSVHQRYAACWWEEVGALTINLPPPPHLPLTTVSLCVLDACHSLCVVLEANLAENAAASRIGIQHSIISIHAFLRAARKLLSRRENSTHSDNHTHWGITHTTADDGATFISFFLFS